MKDQIHSMNKIKSWRTKSSYFQIKFNSFNSKYFQESKKYKDFMNHTKEDKLSQ